MAEVRSVTDRFAVAPQLQVEDLPGLAGRFSLIVNNRPDGEEVGQPCGETIEAAARAAGLDYVAIPVTGRPNDEDVAALREAIEHAQGPVLAYCRTGMRCVAAWALGEAAAGRPIHELRELGAGAGYDLAPLLQSLPPRR